MQCRLNRTLSVRRRCPRYSKPKPRCFNAPPRIPGIVVNDQCSTVIKENNGQWKYQPHGGDWFCGLAMLAPAEVQ